MTKMITREPMACDASCPKPSSPNEPLPRNLPLPYRMPVTPWPLVGRGVRDVPAGAVAAVGEDPDAEHAPDAAHAVDRDGAHRVVDAPALEEEHRLDDDAPRRWSR